MSYDRMKAIANRRQKSRHLRSKRKLRKTFSLSAGTVKLLEHFRDETSQGSDSAALEELVRRWQIAREKERIAAETTAYYDHSSPEEQAADADWGEFAQTGLAAAMKDDESSSKT